jgi:phosphatidate cytidylyltransferase
MLKQRIITALILAPLALWAILYLSNEGFRMALAVVAAMAAWEWSRLVGWVSQAARAGYVLLLVALLFCTELLLRGEHNIAYLLYISLLWWLTALVMIVRYPAGSDWWRENHVARALAGIIVILPMWLALGVIHAKAGHIYVVILVLLVWGADSGAFFAGRTWGRHKLAPHVSPGKSWEGVAGAAVSTLLVGALSAWFLHPLMGTIAFVSLALVTVAFSIIGDLQESMFKRIVDLKDSGGLLPGHGGVLDRIDSLTSAAPIFALGVLWLN